MGRYTNEEARKLVELEIQNRKEALKLYPEVIKVVKQFDGKVLNKRLETALKKIDERLCCRRGCSDFSIEFMGEHMCSTSNNVLYLNIYNYCIKLNTYLDTYRVDKWEASLLENERIRSNILVDSLLRGKEHLEETIVQLENGINRAEEWKDKIKQLKKEINTIRKEIPYLIEDYYDIE